MAIIEQATFETDTENHIVWFDATVVRDTADAQAGVASLLVTQTADFAGVQLNNHPYYPGIVAGQEYDCSVWAKEQTATMPTIDWTINWCDNAGNVLSESHINIFRSVAWAQTTARLTAPTGALRVGWTFDTTTGNGAAWRLDNLLVEDALVTARPFTPLVAPSAAVMRAVL